MKRTLTAALLLASNLAACPLGTAESRSFWDLPPEELRTLLASPQVMVTRTASGWDGYCRCPVVLKPNEIPEATKKAIIAVEDRRSMEHGGVD
jgi:penicillin-binding protein 1A